jgi:hypothetical protein
VGEFDIIYKSDGPKCCARKVVAYVHYILSDVVLLPWDGSYLGDSPPVNLRSRVIP